MIIMMILMMIIIRAIAILLHVLLVGLIGFLAGPSILKKAPFRSYKRLYPEEGTNSKLQEVRY